MLTIAKRTDPDVRASPDPLVTRILQRYPVTCLMVAPYVALAVPQALYYDNPRTSFIVLLIALAAVGAGAIETLFLLLRPPYPKRGDREASNSRYPRIVPVTRVVIVVSVLADITNAVSGGGSILTQLTGRVASSPLVALTTPLSGWKYLSVALLTSACLGGFLTKRAYYKWIALLVAAQFFIATFTAITQPVVSFVSFVALAGLMVGTIRLRVVLATAAVLLLAWPTVFEVRNEIRAGNGVYVSSDDTASERLRFDEQIGKVAGYAVPADLPGVAGPVDILRYGLVPRVLDSGRPLLSTGALINDYIGGSRTSSYSFLPVGNIYFLAGPYGLVAYGAIWAFLLVLLLRTGAGPGPVRLMLLFLAVTGPLGWTNSYPESLVGYIQNVVAMLPVMAALHTFGRAKSRQPARKPALPGLRLAPVRGR